VPKSYLPSLKRNKDALMCMPSQEIVRLPNKSCHSCPEQESPTQPGEAKNEMPVQAVHDRAYMISFREEPTPTPPFGKWRGEKNIKTSISFLHTQESPTQPDMTKTRCPLTPRRTSSRA